MKKYQQFINYKNWHNIKENGTIDVLEHYDIRFMLMCTGGLTDNNALHTLTITNNNPIMLNFNNYISIINYIKSNIVFIRYFILENFYIDIGGQHILQILTKNVIIKNIVFKKCNINLLSKYIPNVLNIHYINNKIILNYLDVIDNSTINNAKCINIYGLGQYHLSHTLEKKFNKAINDLQQHVAQNKKQFKKHMATICYIYLARRYGLLSLLPLDIINVIISYIYLP